MATTTLTVPAKYADDFRMALVHELIEEGEYVKKHHAELLEKARYDERKVNYGDGDLRGAMRLLSRDVEMFTQSGNFDANG